MDRCALFVDAGYVLSDGALAVHGTRNRDSVSWDYEGLLKLLGGMSGDRTGVPLLRCYWYDTAAGSDRSAEHDMVADLPGVKLRVSKLRPNRKEGVEAEIRRDLTQLARNRSVSDVVIVSAEEDLSAAIADAQDLGIRAALMHIAIDGRETVPRALRQECDDTIEISGVHLRPFVELIPGAEPASEDGQMPAAGYRDTAVTFREQADAGYRNVAGGVHAGSYRDSGVGSGPHQAADSVARRSRDRTQRASGENGRLRAASQDGLQGLAGQNGERRGHAQSQGQQGPGSQNGRRVARGMANMPPTDNVAANGFGLPMPQDGAMSHGLDGSGTSYGASGGGATRNGVPAGAGGQNGGIQAPDPRGRDPLGSDPLGRDPLGRDPLGSDPRASDPLGGGPRGRDPLGGGPRGRDPLGGGPRGRDPLGGDPVGRSPLQPEPVGRNPLDPDPVGRHRDPLSGGQVSRNRVNRGPVNTDPFGGFPGQGQAHPGPVHPGQGQLPQPPGLGAGPGLPPQNGVPQNGTASMAVHQPIAPQRQLPAGNGMPYQSDRAAEYEQGPAQFGSPAPTQYAPAQASPDYQVAQYAGPPSAPAAISVGEAVQSAHAEGYGFGEAVARDAPALWLEAVLARKPRMPSDLEAGLLQGSALPIDSLLHDEVRNALRRGFWDALERSRL